MTLVCQQKNYLRSTGYWLLATGYWLLATFFHPTFQSIRPRAATGGCPYILTHSLLPTFQNPIFHFLLSTFQNSSTPHPIFFPSTVSQPSGYQANQLSGYSAIICLPSPTFSVRLGHLYYLAAHHDYSNNHETLQDKACLMK